MEEGSGERGRVDEGGAGRLEISGSTNSKGPVVCIDREQKS